jgi:steroid delta-isomerase-like uncharacterized protein
MSVEENKATARRIIEEVWNKGNFSIISELVSPDYCSHNAAGEDMKGPDGFKQMITLWRTAFPDLRMSIDDVVAEGNKLAVRISWRGTFKGKLGNIKPTGKQVNITEAFFATYKDGKMTGNPMTFYDQLTFYQQLGIQPPG